MSDGGVGGRLIDRRFRLSTPLGGGHSPQVWQAVDERTGRRVAVKLHRPRPGQPPAVRLSHPCVVGIFFVGTHEGLAYTVMELVDGVSLATVLRDGPVPADDAFAIALGVCDALDAAHAAGVTHGNLKPSNVLLVEGDGGGPAVKVGDFTGLGDERADLYSLGLLLEAMTGRRDAIVERLLSREPYTLAQLRAALTGSPVVAAQDPGDGPEPERPRLVRLAVVSGAATLAVVVAGFAWLLRPPAPPDIRAGLTSQAPQGEQPSSATDPAAAPRPPRSVAPPASQPPVSVPAASASTAQLLSALDATRTVVAAQLQSGNIEPQAASLLNDRLDDIARFHSRGQTKQAGDRIDQLKTMLASMLRSGRVTAAGHDAILASVNRLA